MSADLPSLNLGGSRTARINGRNLTVHGDLNLGGLYGLQGSEPRPFSAAGLVDLDYAKIRGEAFFAGGHFHYSETGAAEWEKPLKLALYLSNAEVGGDVQPCCGFESHGCIFLAENTIGGDLNCWGGRFINPNNLALTGGGDDIKGGVFVGPNNGFVPASFGFESDGLVAFRDARVAAFFIVRIGSLRRS